MNKLLKTSFKLTRRAPENFIMEEERHFLPDFEIIIRESHIRLFSNATVVQFFVFNKWSLATAYCLSRKITPKKKLKALIKRLTFKKRKIQEAIWALDQWSFGYFHWLTEVLPRILTAKESGYDYPVLFPKNANKNLYFDDSVSALEIEPHYFSLKERVQVKNLIAPSHLQPAQFDPEQIKQVRNSFRQYDALEQNVSKSKRIYISRTIAQRRYVRNETELERVLSRFGFETVFMEKLSFQEQRKLMSETAFLISNHGAGLTNMIFMPDNATVIELKANADDINNCFFNLARALDHHYYYTINPGDNKLIQRANITVDVEKLNTLLTAIIPE
jgi:capsular polysaccharide biosynthesis protein